MFNNLFTADELAAYQRDGYFLCKGLFAFDEIDKLRQFAEQDPSFRDSVYGRKDATGLETKLALWNDANDNCTRYTGKSNACEGVVFAVSSAW